MVEQLAAVSVVTRQARDLESKNNAYATGRDFCGHTCKADPASDAEPRMSKIVVDSMTFSPPVAGLHGGGAVASLFSCSDLLQQRNNNRVSSEKICR